MRILSLFVLSILSIPVVAMAEPELPENQVIHWSLREDPNDPESTVEIHAVVTLKAREVLEDSIGWSVESVEFIRGEGETATRWIELAPPIDTPDGLWWAHHEDLAEPQLDEFIDTPVLYGRAYSDNPEEADLIYELQSSTVNDPGPFEQTSEVNYLLAAADTSEPVKQGDLEPVETRDTRNLE